MLFLSLSLMVDDIPLAIKALATTGNRESAYDFVIGWLQKSIAARDLWGVL